MADSADAKDDPIQDQSEDSQDESQAEEPGVDVGSQPDASDPRPPLAPTHHSPLYRACRWLRTKPIRLVLAIIMVVLVLGASTVAATDLRYPVFGLVMQSSAEIRVIDAANKQPLPKVKVELAGQTKLSDATGKVVFDQLKPGKTTLKASKEAYATSNQAQTVALTRGLVATIELKSSGVKVLAEVKNTLTGGAVEGVTVTVEEAGLSPVVPVKLSLV